jgi:7,8-dihydropterin-6-yl-methyl-4-(beta-D-ribofuranosyl)aminobenzene 5'-phosphate synthase
MFDYGVEGEGIVKNMKLLEIDLGRLEAFALSHGHYDHWGSLVYLLKGQGARIKKGIPLYVRRRDFREKVCKAPREGGPTRGSRTKC